jgi:hypothetical protein
MAGIISEEGTGEGKDKRVAEILACGDETVFV